MYRRFDNNWAKHLDFILLDLVVFQLVFRLSFHILQLYRGPVSEAFYATQGIVFMLIQIVVIMITEPYRDVLRRGGDMEFLSAVRNAVTILTLDIIYLFAVKESYMFSRAFFLGIAVLFILGSWSVRSLYKMHLRKIRGVNGGDRSLIIFTLEDRAQEVVESLMSGAYTDFVIKGIFLLDQKAPAKQDISGIPVYGRKEPVFDIIGHEWVDEAFFFLTPDYKLPKCYIDNLLTMGITVHFSYSFIFEREGIAQKADKIGSYYVLTNSLRIVNSTSLAMKRILDIFGGLVGCILTGIIFLFVAPAIYIQDPGPIFFSQWRVGKNGNRFKIYKFRSMYMDAEQRKKELMAQNKMNGLMFKMEDDPRIIGSEKKDKNGRPRGIGNFIRNTSLDEFPQFWNVLKGDMSLVGTRPPTIDEWEQYDANQRVRMCVKPGITGVWQVSGRSEITDFDEVVKLDTSYIRDWNILLDLKIILRTVLVVLKREGAV